MMKTKLLLVVFLIIGLVGCKKPTTSDYQSTGVITGVDMKMCACCGGWYIQIDNTTYEFETLPAGSNIDLLNATFPIKVKLDWQSSPKPACPNNKIDILKIVKQ
jgi:hypothetical protein